jgi:hypothetical protein
VGTGGLFETDVRAGRLQRQHASALILIRPRGFVDAITGCEMQRGCREGKAGKRLANCVDKKYKDLDRRWADDRLRTQALKYIPYLPRLSSEPALQPAPSHAPKTHPPSLPTTSDALPVETQTPIHRIPIQTDKSPTLSIPSVIQLSSVDLPPPKKGLSPKDFEIAEPLCKIINYFPQHAIAGGRGGPYHVILGSKQGCYWNCVSNDSTAAGVAWR